MPVRRFL
jgi:hypothetical protein